MAKIHVIGTGEAFDAGLGNNSYLFTGKHEPTLLFDCGYQVPERLWASKMDQAIEAICLTHLHADHAFGLVPLLARFWEEKRKAPLTIFGPRGTETFLKKLFDLGYPGLLKRLPFRIEFVSLSANRSLKWKGLRLTCARTFHSVLNHMIRVDSPGTRAFSFAVSGDGNVTSETRDLAQGVDLLLQEVFSLRPRTPMHADLQMLVPFLAESEIGLIGVAHHSRTDKAKIHRQITRLQKSDRRWFSLQPGMVITDKLTLQL